MTFYRAKMEIIRFYPWSSRLYIFLQENVDVKLTFAMLAQALVAAIMPKKRASVRICMLLQWIVLLDSIQKANCLPSVWICSALYTPGMIACKIKFVVFSRDIQGYLLSRNTAYVMIHVPFQSVAHVLRLSCQHLNGFQLWVWNFSDGLCPSSTNASVHPWSK